MAKRPAKKIAKKPSRPAAKSPAKTSPAKRDKKVAPAPKAKAAKPVAKPTQKSPVKVVSTPPPPPFVARPAPPPPIAVIRPPSADAIAGFERAAAALQKRDFKAAAAAFESLIEQFPNEGPLADRARVYLDAARRELSRQPAGRTTIEERLTAATLALNNHNDSEAARLAADVLNEDGNQDLAEYLLAVVAARGNDVTTAIAHMRNAIALNPECRLQARQDDEFDALTANEEFRTLLDTIPAGGARRLFRKPVR